VLREFANLAAFPELARFGAALKGTADAEGWHLAVLDFAERGDRVPPWTVPAVQQAMTLIADFHASTPTRAAEILRDRAAADLMAQGENWHSLRDAATREKFTALFRDRAAATAWVDAHLDRFIGLRNQSGSIGGPCGWVHMDIRSDNLVFTRCGGLLLVDWPALSFGPQLLDAAFFLPSLAGEGGPGCADGLRLYEQAAGVTFAPGDVAIAAALVAGFFAARAGDPEEAALPRLRWVQKMQLFPALAWLSDCLATAPPPLPRPYQA
jgi:hypothetical protein